MLSLDENGIRCFGNLSDEFERKGGWRRRNLMKLWKETLKDVAFDLPPNPTIIDAAWWHRDREQIFYKRAIRVARTTKEIARDE